MLHDNTQWNKSNNTTFYFRVSYDDSDPSILPVTLTVSNFTEKMKNKESFSSPFFAFAEGYLMLVRVYAYGSGTGEGTHVSVYLHLMKGPHDDKLEQSGHWPLRGTFTIELLNQLNDSNHYSHTLHFYHHLYSKCTNRVLEGVLANSGHGIEQFISHDTLLLHSNNAYNKNDSLIFRISYEKYMKPAPPHQIAPVTFKMIEFSHGLEINGTWFFNPFLLFRKDIKWVLELMLLELAMIMVHMSLLAYIS